MSTKKTHIIVDIETGPIEELAASLFDPESVKYGNAKNPELREKIAEDAKKAFIQKAALHPNTGKVVSIGYLGENDMRPVIYTAKTPRREKTIIKEFFERLFIHSNENAIRLCYGYNFDFDWTFLLTRARILNIKLVRGIEFQMFRQRVRDVYYEMTCGQKYYGDLFPAGTGTLEAMAKGMGVTSKYRKNQCSGNDYARFALSDDLDLRTKARNHLRADLFECRDIARRIGMLSNP